MSFTCPRCAVAADEPYYGPCGRCRTALRSAQRGEARAMAAEAFVPAMRVTPNAVDLKDD